LQSNLILFMTGTHWIGGWVGQTPIIQPIALVLFYILQPDHIHWLWGLWIYHSDLYHVLFVVYITHIQLHYICSRLLFYTSLTITHMYLLPCKALYDEYRKWQICNNTWVAFAPDLWKVQQIYKQRKLQTAKQQTTAVFFCGGNYENYDTSLHLSCEVVFMCDNIKFLC
jgi:hypothetical protein